MSYLKTHRISLAHGFHKEGYTLEGFMKRLIIMSAVVVVNFALTGLINSKVIESPTNRGPASVTKKSYLFNYKDLSKKPFQIKKEATTYEEAYKSASKDCFQQLTQGKYPGEEKGLDIIDICANPKI